MKLIREIPLHLVKADLNALPLEYPQFVLVVSKGYLKIYKQIR